MDFFYKPSPGLGHLSTCHTAQCPGTPPSRADPRAGWRGPAAPLYRPPAPGPDIYTIYTIYTIYIIYTIYNIYMPRLVRVPQQGVAATEGVWPGGAEAVLGPRPARAADLQPTSGVHTHPHLVCR